jgi:hypothetical protein
MSAMLHSGLGSQPTAAQITAAVQMDSHNQDAVNWKMWTPAGPLFM